VTWILCGCWLAALVALAFGHEYLAAALFVVGFVAGAWGEDREQQRRNAAETHRRLLQELRRHR